MNTADWIIIGLMALSCVIGLIRGLIKEALSLGVWLAAFFVASHFKSPTALLLQSAIGTPSLRELTAFGGLFLATLLLGSMLTFLLSQVVKMTGLSGTDRLLGFIFGALRGLAIIMAVVVFVPPLVPIHQDPWWQGSFIIQHLSAFEGAAKHFFNEAGQLLGQWFSSSKA